MKRGNFFMTALMPITASEVKSNDNATPAAAIPGPPAPMNRAPGSAAARAWTSAAALASPLGSPATTMMVWGFISIPLSLR